MTRLFLVIISIFIFSSFKLEPGFTILGSISGNAEGMKVYLESDGFSDSKRIDSAIISNGKFSLKGTLKSSALCRVIIDRTPKGQKSAQSNWLMSRFYLENSAITFSGHMDSLPTYYYNKNRVVRKPVITGSEPQRLLEEFEASIVDLRKQQRALNDEYMKVYHLPAISGTFNTREGVSLYRKEKEVSKQVRKEVWKFIQENSSSVVAFDKAREYFYGLEVQLTIAEIDSLITIVESGYKNAEQVATFKKEAEVAKKTAIGVKYQDMALLNQDGKKLLISSQFPKGGYTLLEFWASWCGPCRGEIPHLREVNKHYKDKGFTIVSISIDEKEQAWKKAMKEENMIWPQLNDRGGFKGESVKAYNITGVPYCLLLDKEGKIIQVGLRGAGLDAALEDIYGTVEN
ncbi:TlpA disulfide reductase family protein [Solitalea canadensis]|uniref:Thiol-disulfide isomerase-like thioredoxin n=1 Tax=Solitalea canadensis (strain ATCC 29591 / DSM 3403 / JCM 21819 / LMG 8368 / NBRC 15130 / NCIMB 12057 / USAM 9D) TaxID=929556 RepID=H8KPX5_SOLCM|nr:TlpA disulfide reductase family protein [Solitalea canadensis]AFD06084.1 thiol-disulfide isomerase-like thioredoxin [Solitalea canadensis DSM 3403]